MEFKVRRAALLLKLLNAPVGSWQHVALVARMRSDWYAAALQDVRLVFPTLLVELGDCPHGLVTHTTGWWNKEGEWISAHPYRFPRDMLGRRGRLQGTPQQQEELSKRVWFHIRGVCRALRQRLHGEQDSLIVNRVVNRYAVDACAKTDLIRRFIACPRAPLHVALNWVELPRHRQTNTQFSLGWAMSFFCSIQTDV